MFLPMQAVANARRRIYLLAPLNQVKKAHRISGIFERGWGGQCHLFFRLLICSVLRRQPLPQGFPLPFSKKRSGDEVAAQVYDFRRRYCNGWVLRDLHPPLVSGHTHEIASFKINNINHHNQRARNDCYKKCTD